MNQAEHVERVERVERLVHDAQPTPSPTIIHLVPHTHWDREWYEPFQTFRSRLVDLLDQLLETMRLDSRLRFTLDGQMAIVDDYLEVRPEAEELIRSLVMSGRLAVGPWQILMDEFQVSGETIIRNLELGWNRADRLGGAMAVGYLPDMFGHIAQMPQILSKAGIDRAVIWRGVPAEINQRSFVWRSPDGSAVRTEYLIGGYGSGAYLLSVPDRFAERLRAYRAASTPFYGDRSILAMYGTDHAIPSPTLADRIDEVNRVEDDLVVRVATLAEYLSAASDDDLEAPLWTGEMRSGARASILRNVISARMEIKAAAGRAERLLERYAEPLTALHARSWPGRQLELAWRRIVDNSAHDSISGCSADSVVAQVMGRFAEAEQLGHSILARTVAEIAQKVSAGAWAVINASPSARSAVVLVEIPVASPSEEIPCLTSSGATLPVQEISRTDPIVARFPIAAADLPELFRRRMHGRELFGYQLNGADVSGDDRIVTLHVGDVPNPPDLDLEDLIDRVSASARTHGHRDWQVHVVRPERRLLATRVAAPGLAWATMRPPTSPPAAAAPLS
ncbi:MAG: alpha-mannosidase, partial [Candidatus Limnocylindrales bacterium]